HAYMVAMRREDGTYTTPQVKKPTPLPATAPNWMWPAAVALVCIVAIGVGGFLYFTKLELPGKPSASSSVSSNAAPPPSPSASPTPAPTAAAAAVPPPPGPAALPFTERLAAEAVPFVSERIRVTLANDYVPAGDYKALALNIVGINGFVVRQPSEEAAKAAAVEQCQKRADAQQNPRKCELYAVGNTIVYAHGKPPVPPQPWIRHDPSVERPFVASELPLVRDQGKARLETSYLPGKKSKAIAVGPGGTMFFSTANETADDVARRNLESCGAVAGVPCMLMALDDVFVVPVPTNMKVTGFFKASGNSVISPDARDDVARKLADASTGWNAVAVGKAGRPGLALSAANERDAVNDALGACVKRDSDCHVVAIGPFSVGPN
ncbi:MAG: hypothetical protein JWR80_5570, partial [Bradyrhizobium sp.]|nr:hypothetical protein [Bradyrhizobium sp.]